MSIVELTPLLQKISLDIIILSFITYVLTNVIKTFLPKTFKNKIGLIPFILGIAFYALYAYFLLKIKDFSIILQKGIQIGGVSTFIYAFIKQLKKSGTIKEGVSDILKGILSSQTIKSAVNEIFKEYSSTDSSQKNAEKIAKILSKSACISEAECSAITNLIIKKMNSDTK